MDSSQARRARELARKARGLDPDARQKYLDRHCADDPLLSRLVRELLDSQEPAEPTPTLSPADTENQRSNPGWRSRPIIRKGGYPQEG